MIKVGDILEVNGKKVVVTYSDGKNYSYAPAKDEQEEEGLEKEEPAKEEQVEEGPAEEEPAKVEPDDEEDDDEEIVPKKRKRK